MSSSPVLIIVGARPNFMKATPLCRALAKKNVPYWLVHTGQHFDADMADKFFNELRLYPDAMHALVSDRPVTRLTEIMNNLEREFMEWRPCLAIVVGDVTSTLAGALVARKTQTPLAHVEAGLRSYNKTMPEEGHRVVTDHISDLLFTPSEEDRERLRGEGITDSVHVVGNIMIDLLYEEVSRVRPPHTTPYYFVTLHRAENVDHPSVFLSILEALEEIAQDAPLYLPLHPRTKQRAEAFGLLGHLGACARLIRPLSYHDSIAYQNYASLVLTDSGGVQEESSVLGVPCLTLRTETERPITVTRGTNTVAGVTKQSILDAYRSILPLTRRDVRIPLWDGKTAERIVTHIETFLHR